MELLEASAAKELAEISFVLCDLDDTLTLDGILPSASYKALEALVEKGRQVIIVTGRPAGWCDMIARLWPVAAVVGENGAFYFRYDRQAKRMLREFQRFAEQRRTDQNRLAEIFQTIQQTYPDVRLAADQAFRISDYAVDFCEDVAPLPESTITDIVRLFEAAGATARVSSIHVNAWIGDFSKLQMSLSVLRSLGLGDDQAHKRVVYVGDSPNDEPMFAHFPLSVGVANIRAFLPAMKAHPRWITAHPGGLGFAEFEAIM